MITLEELGEPFQGDMPWLDRPDPDTHDPLCLDWARDGFVILPGFLPDDLIEFYEDEWFRSNTVLCGAPADRRDGWPYDVPYMDHIPVRELCCYRHLGGVLETLIGEPMGVHLNLSGWRSTQRDWHQDGYLNPDSTRDYYAAVWFALDDIDPDAGPFEYIPGSHRMFPLIREQAMRNALTPEEAGSSNWPRYSERILTPLFEEAIADKGLEPRQFIAKRGDVLIWHPRLLHRGSIPNDPELERRALIAHYSGIAHRPDFPVAQKRDGESWYFPISQIPL